MRCNYPRQSNLNQSYKNSTLSQQSWTGRIQGLVGSVFFQNLRLVCGDPKNHSLVHLSNIHRLPNQQDIALGRSEDTIIFGQKIYIENFHQKSFYSKKNW